MLEIETKVKKKQKKNNDDKITKLHVSVNVEKKLIQRGENVVFDRDNPKTRNITNSCKISTFSRVFALHSLLSFRHFHAKQRMW